MPDVPASARFGGGLSQRDPGSGLDSRLNARDTCPCDLGYAAPSFAYPSADTWTSSKCTRCTEILACARPIAERGRVRASQRFGVQRRGALRPDRCNAELATALTRRDGGHDLSTIASIDSKVAV